MQFSCRADNSVLDTVVGSRPGSNVGGTDNRLAWKQRDSH
jgi:hypothetical protein